MYFLTSNINFNIFHNFCFCNMQESSMLKIQPHFMTLMSWTPMIAPVKEIYLVVVLHVLASAQHCCTLLWRGGSQT